MPNAQTSLSGSCVVSLVALFTSLSANAIDLVVPASSLNVEGSSSDGGPFGEGGGGDFRRQTVYAASEFSTVNAPFLITGITFRPDASPAGGGDSSGWSTTPISLTMLIRLSTTAKPVDGLSSTFAENIGPDQTTVVNGVVSVSSSNALNPDGTKRFDITIDFATPFTYDPALGNLLVDARTLSGGNRPRHTIDGVQVLGDSVSSVSTLFGNGGASVAASNGTYGSITQFAISPVPEASTLMLMLAGVVGIGFKRAASRGA